jgi:hypothetical protein
MDAVEDMQQFMEDDIGTEKMDTVHGGRREKLTRCSCCQVNE